MRRTPDQYKRRGEPSSRLFFSQTTNLSGSAEESFSPLRRRILQLSPLLLLAGCDSTPEGPVESFLRRFQRFNDWVQARMFDPHKLAPEYSDEELVSADGFRTNSYDTDQPDIDPDRWNLSIDGMVSRPGTFTLDQLQALPKRMMNTRHVCVEGWSMIVKWGGTPLHGVLEAAGADLNARYLAVECGDDYTTSYDMPSALHPQTLLCYEAFNKPLSLEHGAPVRIAIPTKLGYKNAKWIRRLTVTNDRPGGYWEDQGYDWFAGI